MIPSDLATRGDLDRAELENILEGQTRAYRRTWRPTELLDSYALADLHRRMFGQVWRWAGSWRRRETSIGIAPESIQVVLRMLLDDTLTWIQFQTYPPDEIALRFHHRLVAIHPFPNGNGRHARLVADLLVRALARPVFSWGGDPDRRRYQEALRALDRDRDAVGLLLAFARAQPRRGEV